jgi:hypothetical protein
MMMVNLTTETKNDEVIEQRSLDEVAWWTNLNNIINLVDI